VEERLQKVLARAGVASRREAERLIAEGRVTVNDRVIREFGVKVDPRMDEIRVDTLLVARDAAMPEARRVYLLLNKPKGVVCTVRDTHGRTTVLDLVPPFEGRRLYPVGRLDEDSEGLVLMTNDGDLTDRLTHPRYGVSKTYDVRVKGRVTEEEARRFEAGVWLSEGRTGRSRVRIRRAGTEVTHVAITLYEGRNREIRRAFGKLGFPVLSVRRIRIGPVEARGLHLGQYRPLAADELAALRDAAAGRETAPRPRRHARRPGDEGPKRPRRRPGKPDPAKAPRPERPHDQRGPRGRRRGRGGGRRW
jgi:23S rRNA pseudouridine2605 synthase